MHFIYARARMCVCLYIYCTRLMRMSLSYGLLSSLSILGNGFEKRPFGILMGMVLRRAADWLIVKLQMLLLAESKTYSNMLLCTAL